MFIFQTSYLYLTTLRPFPLYFAFNLSYNLLTGYAKPSK
nr:MAG TPA: hypothetical protein [Caudoviricetes sp.]